MLRPEGAFYAFPRVRGIESSLDFVKGVLAEENVGLAVTPLVRAMNNTSGFALRSLTSACAKR